MKDKPSVSVVIPTKNSEKTLAKCLESIKNQSYNNVEVIVVDSYSTDKTNDVAKKHGAKIFFTKWKLLGARYIGYKKSRGDYVLLLDSDQILEKTSVERAIRMAHEGYDMLCLEEQTYETKTWVQRLLDADKRPIRQLASIRLDPLERTSLARLYKRELLKEAFEAIPQELMPSVILYDHAIIYFEAFRISQKVGYLSNAVWHIEPDSLIGLWKKYYRYGKSMKRLVQSGFYRILFQKKERLRKGIYYNWKSIIQMYLLSILKGIAYQIGYWSG